MAKEIKLTAARRQGRGTSTATSLRRTGMLPAVVCGAGKSRSIQINAHSFEQLLRDHSGENLIFDVDIEGEGVTKVLLKEVQQGPVYGELLHADFLEISMTRKMRVSIPIEFEGEPVGVTQEGGVLEHALRSLDVECLPGDLVDAIKVNVTALSIGHSIMVRDLMVDPKLMVLTGPDVAVATCIAPRAEVAPVEEAAATAEAAAEPEVIGKKAEEGEEGEGEKKPEKGEKAEKKPEKAEKPEKRK